LFKKLTNRFSIRLVSSEADFLIDITIELEQEDLYKVKRLMELAIIVRLTGSFIKEKIEEYRKLALDNKTNSNTTVKKRLLSGKVFYHHIAKAWGNKYNNYLTNFLNTISNKTSYLFTSIVCCVYFSAAILPFFTT